MQSRIADIRALDAEVLAISVDSTDDNRRLAESAKLEFPILSDVDLTAIDAFGLRHSGAGMTGGDLARPAVFVIGRKGRVTWRNLTDNWRVRVRPKTILERLEEIP